MNKGRVIGLIVIILLIGGAVGYKVASDRGWIQAAVSSAKKGVAKITGAPTKGAEFKLNKVAPIALGETELGGKKVPLIEIPLDTWGGYACLIRANAGQAEPSAESLFFKRGGFAVRLTRVESATAQLAGFAAGTYPILWSSADAAPLIAWAFKQAQAGANPPVRPQVFGLFDWSSGGDGILVKEGISSPQDLRGKTILTSGSTPSNYFLSWILEQSGVRPDEVKLVYLPDGEKAYAAFKAKKDIAAWVTWSPYLERATDAHAANAVKGARALVSTRDATQLIADACLTRSDFAAAHPEMLSAFLGSLFSAYDQIEKNPDLAAQDLAGFYALKGGSQEGAAMLRQVHLANFTDNLAFFDPGSSLGASSIFSASTRYLKDGQALPRSAELNVESLLCVKGLAALQTTKEFAKQVNRLAPAGKAPGRNMTQLLEQKTVLREEIDLRFDAQQIEFNPDSPSQEVRDNLRELAKVAQQTEVLGTTVVKIIGRLDTSRVAEYRDQGAASFMEARAQAKLLSKKRAEFIKRLLVERYRVEADRVVTEGHGWEDALSAADNGSATGSATGSASGTNTSQERRLEIRFLSFE
jgi:ABC-type nitrate/sulfonate/bicarbonate transport system substrate-binding protein/outer membrane protein OmpA-like peptidoglycan-associated protein